MGKYGNAPRRDNIVIWIYALADPETGEHRYVGSSQDPVLRLEGHIAESFHWYGNRAKAEWIQGLLKRDLRPVLVLLESAPNRQRGWEVEHAWIRECQYRGCPLVPTRRPPFRWKRDPVAPLQATRFEVA